MDDEKYFGLTPAQLNLAFFAAVGAVALAAFVYFGGVGAVEEYLGEEQVAVVETGAPTPAPTEVPAAVPAQEQEEKPAAESDPPPPPPQVEEPPVDPPPQVGEPPADPPPPPPKPTPTPEPPKPSVAPYWVKTAPSVGLAFVYHPNVDCQLGGNFGHLGWVLCSSPTEGWTLDCRFNSGQTMDCTHSRDGDFTCGGDSAKTTCVGAGLTSTCTDATNDNPIDLTCSRSDGETLKSPYGTNIYHWSGGSFVCVREDPNWTCN